MSLAVASILCTALGGDFSDLIIVALAGSCTFTFYGQVRKLPDIPTNSFTEITENVGFFNIVFLHAYEYQQKHNKKILEGGG